MPVVTFAAVVLAAGAAAVEVAAELIAEVIADAPEIALTTALLAEEAAAAVVAWRACRGEAWTPVRAARARIGRLPSII